MKSILSISVLVAALGGLVEASPRAHHEQKILEIPNITRGPNGFQAKPTATSSSSSYTCDFAPRPTGACELGELVPFPFNCSMFFMCTSFGPLMQHCPNTTIFDFKKKKCLLANATDCTGCCLSTDCDAK